ncbi:MAG: hypothetical protein JWN74_1144 [Acidobacteriaceae bacterium]|nr:hypothetical protein [Acidobacteriaceae bacterium]
MTRAVVFLAAAMVAASLGVVAQDVSGEGTNSAPQNNTNNNPQHTVTVAAPQANASGQDTGTSAAGSTTHDSAKSATTHDHSANGQNPTQTDDSTIATNGQLPQTSTILPLLGLIGLGSLVAGFFARH